MAEYPRSPWEQFPQEQYPASRHGKYTPGQKSGKGFVMKPGSGFEMVPDRGIDIPPIPKNKLPVKSNGPAQEILEPNKLPAKSKGFAKQPITIDQVPTKAIGYDAGEFQGPPNPWNGVGPDEPQQGPKPFNAREEFVKKVGKGRPQPQYDAPIGPDLPKAQYDEPIGPREPVQGPGPDFLKGEPNGPHLPKVKSFISEVGDLLAKYGVPAEVLEHAAPIVGKLSKYVLGPAAVGLTGYDISQNPANPEDESDRAAAFQSGKMFPKGMVPPPGGSTGRMMKDLKAGPTASQGSQDELQASSPSAGSQDSPAPFLEAPSPTGDMPPAITQSAQSDTGPGHGAKPPGPHFTQHVSHIQQNHPSKAPLSDEEIVAWNAQHNPGFKQAGGTSSFQPSQGPKQSDGILFVGGNVYMSDPRAPDGYKLVHSYN